MYIEFHIILMFLNIATGASEPGGGAGWAKTPSLLSLGGGNAHFTRAFTFHVCIMYVCINNINQDKNLLQLHL